jgi:DNA-binding transcriptional MerR regulator
MNNVKMCLVLRILRTFRASRRTIRIWEKRYDILQPMRTDTNIRLYDLELTKIIKHHVVTRLRL